jgi:hypothetical protein
MERTSSLGAMIAVLEAAGHAPPPPKASRTRRPAAGTVQPAPAWGAAPTELKFWTAAMRRIGDGAGTAPLPPRHLAVLLAALEGSGGAPRSGSGPAAGHVAPPAPGSQEGRRLAAALAEAAAAAAARAAAAAAALLQERPPEDGTASQSVAQPSDSGGMEAEGEGTPVLGSVPGPDAALAPTASRPGAALDCLRHLFWGCVLLERLARWQASGGHAPAAARLPQQEVQQPRWLLAAAGALARLAGAARACCVRAWAGAPPSLPSPSEQLAADKVTGACKAHLAD